MQVSLLLACLSRFLNCANGTISRKVSQVFDMKMVSII